MIEPTPLHFTAEGDVLYLRGNVRVVDVLRILRLHGLTARPDGQGRYIVEGRPGGRGLLDGKPYTPSYLTDVAATIARARGDEKP